MVVFDGLQCTCSRQLMAIATSRTQYIQQTSAYTYTRSQKRIERVKTNTHSRPNVRRACGRAISGLKVCIRISISLIAIFSTFAHRFQPQHVGWMDIYARRETVPRARGRSICYVARRLCQSRGGKKFQPSLTQNSRPHGGRTKRCWVLRSRF